jgi:hypothetical protein
MRGPYVASSRMAAARYGRHVLLSRRTRAAVAMVGGCVPMAAASHAAIISASSATSRARRRAIRWSCIRRLSGAERPVRDHFDLDRRHLPLPPEPVDRRDPPRYLSLAWSAQ